MTKSYYALHRIQKGVNNICYCNERETMKEHTLTTHAKQRINWVDISKGIAILSVLLGHTVCPAWLHAYIYSFHMPLFFILSGYTLSFSNNGTFRTFITRKAKALLAPYICFAPLIVLFNLCVNFFKFGITAFEWKNTLISVFFQRHLSDHKFELWFLISLFSAELVLYFLYFLTKRLNSSYWLPLISGVVMLSGFLYWHFCGIPLVWNFDVTLIAVGFIGFGYLLRILKEPLEKANTWPMILLLCAVHLLFTVLNNDAVNMYENKYGNILFFLLAATAGSLFFIFFSQKIRENNLLQMIGKHSLILYCLHTMLYTVLSVASRLFFSFDFDLVLTNHGDMAAFGVCILITLLETAILLPIAYAIERWCPFIIGRSKLK